MPGILEQLTQQATRDENAGLALAAQKATWANQFNSYTPEEKLREKLDVVTAMDGALRRRMELEARGDLKAQELLHRERKFEQWEKDAPLRTELLERKVASEGAHERFVQRKDAESMTDIAGFFETVGKIPARPGTPEYQSGLNAAIQRHPRIIGTQAGADALKNLQREHQDVAAITPPAGMEVDRIDIGDDGRAKAVFKPAAPPSGVVVPEGMVPSGATVNKRGDVSVNYSAPKAEKDAILPHLEKERSLYTRELSKARDRRLRAEKESNKGLQVDADNDSKEYQQKLEEVESQIRTHRAGGGHPASPRRPPRAPQRQQRLLPLPTSRPCRAARSSSTRKESNAASHERRSTVAGCSGRG